MAGRFSHLEFSPEDERRHQPRSEGVAKASAEQYLQSADEAHRWGDFELALRLHTRCLKENRAMIPAWVGQVQMLVQLAEYHEARLWADKALELFRNNGELMAAKAQACARGSDFRAAYACNDAAMAAPGSSPWRWQVRGEILLARKEPRHVDCFEKSLIEPSADWFDRIVIARICLFYHQATAALRWTQQAVELKPEHAYNWFMLGQCQRELGWSAPAMQSYKRCLELRADFRPARMALLSAEHDSSWSMFWRRVRRRLRGGRTG